LKDIPSTEVVFCDLDGTIVDSELYRISSYYNTLDELGFQSKRVPLKQLVGYHPKENLKKISPKLSGEDIQKVLGYRNENLAKNISDEIKLIPNVYEGIRSFFPNIVIVTNSTTQYAKAIIAHFGLTVESIVSSDMLKDLKPKPSPEMYTYAFRTYLPLEATRVVFEDSSAGLQSAVDAGADYIIAITTDGQASLHSPALDL
jgi:HAD superfamily hydrolase (TIGR01509 family)